MIKDKRTDFTFSFDCICAGRKKDNILNFNEIVGYISHVIFILRKATYVYRLVRFRKTQRYSGGPCFLVHRQTLESGILIVLDQKIRLPLENNTNSTIEIIWFGLIRESQFQRCQSGVVTTLLWAVEGEDYPSTRSSLAGVLWLVSIFLISAIAHAGLRCFGHDFVQFIMVWHLKTEYASFIFSKRSAW